MGYSGEWKQRDDWAPRRRDAMRDAMRRREVFWCTRVEGFWQSVMGLLHALSKAMYTRLISGIISTVIILAMICSKTCTKTIKSTHRKRERVGTHSQSHNSQSESSRKVHRRRLLVASLPQNSRSSPLIAYKSNVRSLLLKQGNILLRQVTS